MTKASTIRTNRIRTSVRCASVATAGLCLMLTGCSSTTSGRPAAGPDLGHWQPPPIQATQLAGLLLTPSDVNNIGGSTHLAVRAPIAEMANDDDAVPNPSCLDIYSPIQQTVYRDSNWNDVRGQVLNDAGPMGSARHAVIQALVGFRDAESAQQFFRQARQRWSACANKSVTVVRPGRAASTWAFGDVATTDNTLTATQTPDGGSGYTCQRAMGLRNNVIIDTLWCGFDTTNQAGQVVSKIGAEVSHT